MAITADRIKVKILKIFRAFSTPILLLVFSILTVILIIITITSETDYINMSVEDSATKYLRTITYQQKEITENSEQLLAILAQRSEVLNYTSPQCDAYLGKILAENDVYGNFGVANLAGDVVCSAIRPANKVNVSDRSYFIKTTKTKEYTVGDFQISRITGKPTIALARPVYNSSDQMIGVLAASLDLNWLNDMTNYEPPPQGSIVSVFDDSSKIIFRYPNNQEWMGKDMPETIVFDRALSYTSGNVKTKGSDSKERIYAFSPFSGNDNSLFVVVGLMAANHKTAITQLFVDRPIWLMVLSLITIGFILVNIILLATRGRLKKEK